MDPFAHGTSTWWWETHCKILRNWNRMKENIQLRFHILQELELRNQFKGMEDLHEYIDYYEARWKMKEIPQE